MINVCPGRTLCGLVSVFRFASKIVFHFPGSLYNFDAKLDKVSLDCTTYVWTAGSAGGSGSVAHGSS